MDETQLPIILCACHLRWNFVHQRPQHIMSRLSATHRVFYLEEPVTEAREGASMDRIPDPSTGVTVLVPRLAIGEKDPDATIARLIAEYLPPRVAIKWIYSPMMLAATEGVEADLLVHDCMDELANFAFAPEPLLERERALLAQADLVFTGGASLFEAKRHRHPDVHLFPSSVDQKHFARARVGGQEPAEQAPLSGPRLGYFGVIDERLDLALVAALAKARPQWSIILVGPVVKIDPSTLPRAANIHYFGQQDYARLPEFLRGWDAALMPFAMNEATRFISPTKTPEYLAGGKPVVSTPIRDVVARYGDLEGVKIAEGHEDFVEACEAALALPAGGAWLRQADDRLAGESWDQVVADMVSLFPPSTPARPKAHSVTSSLPEGDCDVLVVGAGFAGAVMAERLASDADCRVVVIDQRSHIGGNAFDEPDAAGVLIHRYGPHIFHTNSDEIFDYLSRFTAWHPYSHKVRASVRGMEVPMPINRDTLNQLFGLNLTDAEAVQAFLAQRAEPVDPIRTSEDVVVSTVGRELYELFFRGYTRKQWGLDPSELDKSVTARVPTRDNDDDRYFTDRHQVMPAEGYTRMFTRMLDHPNIGFYPNVALDQVRERLRYRHMIYTGPIDAYFDHCYGRLPYRSLRFEHRHVPMPRFQSVGVVNYPDETIPYTRITEYKHLTGQQHPGTSITVEYPAAGGDPYYPIPRPENQELYRRYLELADREDNVTFVGRLATYRYYNMDQVVGQALAAYRRLAPRLREELALVLEAAE